MASTERCVALAMPKEIIEPMIAKRRAEINSDHEGDIWQDIIFYLAKEFNVGKYQAKKRVIDIGHWQARGAANYIVTKKDKDTKKTEGHYICPFMFAKENCPSSAYTYVITPEQAYRLYMENAAYRKLISSGEFVYVDGHVCIASPEYVEQGIKEPQLTEWANRHVDECCLRFKNVYQANEEYSFSLIYICSDEEYNKHYCEFVTRGKKMSIRAANELASKISEEMPRRAGKAVAYLLEVDGKVQGKKPLSLERFAECCGVSRATAYRWCDEDCQLKPEEFMRIVIGLHLPPNISMQFMTTCGIVLNHYGVQEMYWFILLTRFMDSIYEVNNFLESEGFPTFKIATV